MLIVEGPDGAGKTTLIQQLQEYIGWIVAPKAVSSEMQAMTDIQEYVEMALAKGFHPLIYDRFALISGPIYGSIYGMKGTNTSFEDFYWLNMVQHKFLYEVKPIVIWCLPPFETTWENIVADLANRTVNQDSKRARQIYWLYHCRAALEPVPIIYDYERTQIPELITLVDLELEKRINGNTLSRRWRIP